MAYVPKSGTVYAFGLGESGQLGISSVENKNSPVSVGTETCFLINGFHSFMQEDSQNPQLTVKSIYAGWDQSFLIATDQGVSCIIFEFSYKCVQQILYHLSCLILLNDKERTITK